MVHASCKRPLIHTYNAIYYLQKAVKPTFIVFCYLFIFLICFLQKCLTFNAQINLYR